MSIGIRYAQQKIKSADMSIGIRYAQQEIKSISRTLELTVVHLENQTSIQGMLNEALSYAFSFSTWNRIVKLRISYMLNGSRESSFSVTITQVCREHHRFTEHTGHS
jgi:hypothetical protein